MLDCYSEWDAGISDLEEQDSGSNHFKRIENQDVR